MPYIGVSPQFGVRRKHTYTATAGQTSFSGAGSEGATLSYTDSNFVDVYQNGVKLGDADYTSTSGTAIVLAQGASVDDLVEIIVFDAFSVADTVSKADGGTFDGNVTIPIVTASTSVKTPLIEFTDGDDALTIADGGNVTANANLTVTGNTTLNGKFIIDGSNNDLMLFRTTGDTASQVLGLQFQNDSEAVTSQIFATGDASSSHVLRLKSLGSIELHGGDVAVSGDATNMLKVASDGQVSMTNNLDVTGTTTTDNLTVEGSGVNFTVNQTSGNLTATFKGAGLGTMELEGTSSGAFIDMKQGDNDFDVRYGGNNSGGYISNNSASFSISGTGSFTATIVGALSKSSGSFKINHPLEAKKNTHHLFHSFIEGPQCDNLYRGKVDLVNGTASINIDTKAGMTEGTFVALNRDIQCFTTNETGWTAIKGSVSGNVLTITAQDNTCTDTISWLVIGERQDDEIKASSLTDDEGNLIVEKLKSEAPDANQNYGNAE